MSDDVWLQAQKVSKHFGAVVALHEVELAIRLCEVIALVGDNGAGKSTLVKILAGAHPLSSGSIAINNQVVLIDSPVKARSLGIATIFQELALIENLTVLAAGGIDIAVSGVLGISAIFIGWSVEAGWLARRNACDRAVGRDLPRYYFGNGDRLWQGAANHCDTRLVWCLSIRHLSVIGWKLDLRLAQFTWITR